jgi:hypothetical protein
MKKQKTNLIKKLMILSSATLIAGCSLEVPNIEVCADKGILGAFCSYTNMDRIREVPERQWASERFGWFCMSPESFEKNQRFFEEACNQTKNCRLEELKERMRKFEANIEKGN